MSRYEDMSDAELIADLRANLHDRSWTMGQMAELERRGFDSIASDEELHAAVVEDYAELQDKLRKAFAPAMERFELVSGLSDKFKKLNEASRSSVASAFADWKPITLDLPTVQRIESLAPPAWESFPVVEPRFDPIIDRLAEDAERDVEQEQRALAVQIEQLETLRDLRDEASRWNQRTWFDWAILGAAVIAAIAGIVALLR